MDPETIVPNSSGDRGFNAPITRVCTVVAINGLSLLTLDATVDSPKRRDEGLREVV